jgi:RNA-dependent RNA polymerase
MLYDQVELVDFKPRYENRFDSRILNAFELDEAILQTAAMLKSQYDAAISRLMAKHGIRTEFEVWSVFVLAHNQEGRDYKFAEEFGQTVDAIKDQFREACREASRNALGEDDTNPATGRTDILPFVAAMYTVTAREMSDALQDCHKTKIVGGKEVPLRKLEPEEMPLMSFPWLFHIELGIIATGALRQPDLVPNQQYPKKAKRHAACREPGAAGIETELGITSVGDWLELEFGDLKPDKKEAEIGLSGGKSSTGTIQNEKQDKKPDGHSKDVGTDLSGQKSSRTSNEEAIRQDESDDEAFGPGLKEVKIPMSGSKASALDKLARLE